MSTTISEAHSDRLIELTTFLKSTMRSLTSLLTDSQNYLNQNKPPPSNKREASIELRKVCLQLLEDRLQNERQEYLRKI
jgi:hypothetical protein